MPITVVEQGPPVHDHARSVPETPLGFPRRYSFGQTLRSRYHAFWYHLGKRLAWSRGIYRERPAERLQHLSGIQQERMASLRRRFRVRFEQRVEQLTALKQYDYLDILAQAWSAWKLPHPTGGVVQDIGSSNFWYAPRYTPFFVPRNWSASKWKAIGFISMATVVSIMRTGISKTCRTPPSSSATMPATIARLTS